MNSKTWLNCWRGLTRVHEKWLNYVRMIQLLFAIYYIIIIIVNNQPTANVSWPEGYNLQYNENRVELRHLPPWDLVVLIWPD